MANILVVGGAGYVGSATCAWLKDQGHEVSVLDNLSTGHIELAIGHHFYFGAAGDEKIVSKILRERQIHCVMHFAARSLVAESVLKPKEYQENNVEQTKRLLHCMLSVGVKAFVFSSTCAVFGETGTEKIDEALTKKPINPYGQTKLEVEQLLESLSRSEGLKSIVLRYFNAAGAEPGLRVGEWHDTETHLIPRVLRSVQTGDSVEIYGTDYSTQDGTCVRDYVHVSDLAQAHGAAMKRLLEKSDDIKGCFEDYNLGTQNGYSVRNVIEACEKVTGSQLRKIEKPRRSGDPGRLVADASKARQVLGFGENLQDLESIVSSAWKWEQKKKTLFRKAVFVDRDGTLNEDPGYLNDPNLLKLLPGVGESLALLKEKGYKIIVISNQSGVGRGWIQIENLEKIHIRLEELLKPWAVTIDGFGLCLHRPDENCDCRKPKPKLILDIAKKFQFDLKSSFMIGDKSSDIEAGKAAGCKGSVLVLTGTGKEALASDVAMKPDFVGSSLIEAADWLVKLAY